MGPDIRAVVFDFDYTLADSSEGVVQCVNYALDQMGLPQASPDAIRPLIGISLHETLVHLAGSEHRQRGDEFFRCFVYRADQVMEGMTRVYDTVPELMDDLRARGLSTGILSSKFRYRIEAVLERDGLTGRFNAIVGYEDVAAPKPNPEGLLKIMSDLNVSKDNCLYVGDSPTDAHTAMQAGVPFAAVLTGATPADGFSPFPCVAILRDLTELPSLLS